MAHAGKSVTPQESSRGYDASNSTWSLRLLASGPVIITLDHEINCADDERAANAARAGSFLAAGQLSLWSVSSLPASKNQHNWRRCSGAGDTAAKFSTMSLDARSR
jgi:hypothetical protein